MNVYWCQIFQRCLHYSIQRTRNVHHDYLWHSQQSLLIVVNEILQYCVNSTTRDKDRLHNMSSVSARLLEPGHASQAPLPPSAAGGCHQQLEGRPV